MSGVPSIEIKVPQMGESIREATVADWRFTVGSTFESGEILVELETDKVTLEVPAPVRGSLKEIKQDVGANVQVGDVLAYILEASQGHDAASVSVQKQPTKTAETPTEINPASQAIETVHSGPASIKNENLAPGAARLAQEENIDVSQIAGSGKRGQVTKSDIVAFIDASKPQVAPAKPTQSPSPVQREEVVPMSRLRQRIAERLVEAQQTAAILTTFNEIDMHNIMELRKRHKDLFEKTHGVGLGFMSIFVKAAIHALRAVPAVNAEIRQSNIVYKRYYDISVAVGGPKGLVVPVIRDADKLSYAEIEKEIIRLATKVKEGTIELQDLEGGTFTISNGGIYGSMLSTPILNPPQSGILGIHNIVKRPVVVSASDSEISIRPIMFVALSYDHRIIDGKEAVTFLVKLKQAIENPERILLEI